MKAVFFWIKSFTPYQKRQFSAMYGITGKAKTGYWKVYQSFLAADDLLQPSLQKTISVKNFFRDLDTVERSLRRCKKAVDASGSRHASLVFRTLKAISHINAFGKEYKVSEPFRKEFHDGLGDWVVLEENWYFDLLQWLEARHRKMTSKELHFAGDNVWHWNGHLDEVDPARSMYRVFYPKPYFLPFLEGS